METQKIINLADKGLEMVSEMDRKSMYKNLLGNLFFEIRKEAINYSRCCKSDSEQFICECGESTIYQTKSSNMKWCNKCGKVHT